ncbi:MAG: hypothetical protein JW883_03440 [Deltaproteobacteria bacterium]|nr:hypothetical protein [Deltaproteobacteria bacterium]
MWYYETRVGTFSIRPDANELGSWLLCIDAVQPGSYSSPELAASDVHDRSTGWDKWDMLEDAATPTDLGPWSVSVRQRTSCRVKRSIDTDSRLRHFTYS